MGCTQSKIENEEAVARCKDRKQQMKLAVSARNAFAAAHSSYAMDLKNTGAALSDYAQGEVQNPQLGQAQSNPSSASAAAAAAAVGAPKFVETLPPPPPPPSNYNTTPLQRAATMPEIQIPRPEPKPKPKTIEEEDEDEIENEASSSLRRRRSSRRGSSGGGVREVDEAPPPPPQMQPQPQPQEKRTTPNTASYQQQETYDYFFNVDTMPGPTLSGMEELNISKEEMTRNGFGERPKIVEEEEEEEVRSSSSKVEPEPEAAAVVVEEAPPQPPPAPEAAVVVARRDSKKGKQVGSGSGEGKRNGRVIVNLVDIFGKLDDNFLKASESAHEVSKMLEATRLYYHSNFADNRGE